MIRQSDIVSFIGALTVGILSNVYAGITSTSSFIVAIAGILFLVPVSTSYTSGTDSILTESNRGELLQPEDCFWLQEEKTPMPTSIRWGSVCSWSSSLSASQSVCSSLPF